MSAIASSSAAVSRLYDMRVVHHSIHKRAHRLATRVVCLLLDLDELPALDRRLRFFSNGRFNLVGFDARDHGDGSGQACGNGLRAWVVGQLAEAGIDADLGRIRLLCMPRLLGRGFNPISVYFCHALDGNLAALLYEVRNTFGQKHAYAIPVAAGQQARVLHHDAGKALHVSPFMPMTMSYRFTLRRPPPCDPDGRLTLAIDGCDVQRTLIRAVMSGTGREITDAALLRRACAHPLQGLRVFGRIHWEAILLLFKGARFRSKPAAPRCCVTAGTEVCPGRLSSSLAKLRPSHGS